MKKNIKLNKSNNQVINVFIFFYCVLMIFSCKEEAKKNKYIGHYIFISKPSKNDIIKYNGGIWNVKRIDIINLNKRDTITKEVNFDDLLLNDKGFVQNKSNLIIGKRLKVNSNLFNFKKLDSLNGNYFIKFMTKDSILMSSGPVIKIVNKDVLSKQLVHIEILLIKNKRVR